MMGLGNKNWNHEGNETMNCVVQWQYFPDNFRVEKNMATTHLPQIERHGNVVRSYAYGSKPQQSQGSKGGKAVITVISNNGSSDNMYVKEQWVGYGFMFMHFTPTDRESP
jgi:hypothetical protein